MTSNTDKGEQEKRMKQQIADYHNTLRDFLKHIEYQNSIILQLRDELAKARK